MPEIASALKIAGHKKRLEAFLRGESIFPVTLELDITTHCTRKCTKCPMIRSSTQRHLDFEFVKNLFSRLEGQTGGLLVAGGEPTLAPAFPKILAVARKCGFQQIAIVTNGSLLHDHTVADALLSHATVVRVSMYTWGEDKCGGNGLTLRQVESLRTRAEKYGSGLDIGVSVLTWKDRSGDIAGICDAVRSAGRDQGRALDRATRRGQRCNRPLGDRHWRAVQSPARRSSLARMNWAENSRPECAGISTPE